MQNNIRNHPRFRSAGLTLVEILMVISVLVIILSFALPSMTVATARAELKAANENVEYTIGAARSLARRMESPVVLDIQPSADGASQRVSLSMSAHDMPPGLQDYQLPESIEIVADHPSFTFDDRGVVQNPGRILLVARSDNSVSAELQLQ